MNALLLVLLVLDVAAIAACLRLRLRWLGIALCGAVVPLAFVVAAITLGAADREMTTGAVPSAQFLVIGYSALVIAAVAILWTLCAAVRTAIARRSPERLAARDGAS